MKVGFEAASDRVMNGRWTRIGFFVDGGMVMAVVWKRTVSPSRTYMRIVSADGLVAAQYVASTIAEVREFAFRDGIM